MKKKAIAFVSTYTHPSRDSVERTVREAFPEYDLENIDLLQFVKQRREWRIPNVVWTAMEYGPLLLSGRTHLKQAYFWTTYLYRKIHEHARELIDPARHVFSFQTQSMFDTSVPGVPHFMYTDHTHLSNLHSPYFDKRMLRPRRWIALEQEAYRHASRVFTRSSDVAEDLNKQYQISPDKVACVYAGSNVHVEENFRLDNAGYSNRRILFVGGDWERKGGPDLEQAFPRVLQTFPDAHLTIAGCSPRLNLPNCTILGRVPLAELSAHYAQASVFCLPTRLEPFGIVFIEAMMHRLPLVGTRVGAVPDLILDGASGRLVEPGDALALSNALLSLLADPDRCRQFGERGYQHATENYTWRRVGQRMRESIVPVLNPAVAA